MYVMQNLHWFIIFIGALVLFHELGHFVVAKLVDVKVERFSFGFGPKLFGFTVGETDYRVAAFPLGGYVKMLGEVPGQEIPAADAPRAFSAKALWKRSLIVLAGPSANFALAWVVFFGLSVGNHTFADTRLGIVSADEPAWEAGLRPGDKILSVNGRATLDWDDLRNEISTQPGTRLEVVYERAGQRFETVMVPRAQDEANLFKEIESRGRVGISPNYVKPILGVVDPESPAARAGLETGDVIEKVGKVAITGWHEVKNEIARVRLGDPVRVTVRRGEGRMEYALVPEPQPAGLDPSLFSAADTAHGYTGIVSQESLVAKVEADTPAAEIGLVPGDRLLRLVIEKDGRRVERPIGVWGIDLLAFDGIDATSDFVLTFQHGREVVSKPLKLVAREQKDKLKNVEIRYVFGAVNAQELRDGYTFERAVGVGEALGMANKAVWAAATLVGKGMMKLVKREIPLSTMGGPIMLFQIAAESAEQGVADFLSVLAVISVNLGLLNLMPIPVLDGGHLVMFTVEGLRRRPPSLRFREVANLVGLALLLLLMLLVFHNDIRRLLPG